MTGIHDRIRRVYEESGKSQADFARSLRITPSYVGQLLSQDAKKEPSPRLLQIMATVYGVNYSWLHTGDGDMRSTPPIPEAMRPKLLPILGKVPAGFPDDVFEEIEGYIAIPDAPDNAYVLRVKGNSMSPEIKDGDFVVFIPYGDIKSGDVVVALNEWGESMIKKYIIKGDEVWFVSSNPEHPSFKAKEEYRLIGKVVDAWSRRKF